MMNFTLSNQVQIPAVGIGTFIDDTRSGRAGGCGRISLRIPHDRHCTGLHE